MNARQFEILKLFTGLPLINLRKLSKAFKVDYQTVLKVQSASNYEAYASEADPPEMLRKMTR